jgi:SAM-dependent methyltransferase
MREMDEVRREFGDWTAHSIRLPDGGYTKVSEPENHLLYVRRVLQAVGDLVAKPLNEARVLDLACLEGGFSVEFALHGASVVAVDGRLNNLAKLEFARDKLGCSQIQVVQDDVRNVTAARFGRFDAVLCLGVFYHLDAASLEPFLRNLWELSTRLVVIDTHISLFGGESLKIGDREYAGATQPEHGETDDPATIARRNWASLDNRTSFYLTDAALLNLLSDLGFSSIYTCEMPNYRIMSDRRTYVALKGRPLAIRCDDRAPKTPVRREEKPAWRVVEPVNRAR